MKCINCYQEIPEGSRFCPHCGAQQPAGGKKADTYAGAGTQNGGSGQTNAGYQENAGYQNGRNAQGDAEYQYGQGQQGGQYNNPYSSPYGAQQDGRQDNQYYGQYNAPNSGQSDAQQNAQYNEQNSTQYQYAQYSQEEPVNWVPYLILSIISTVCCCIPLGIVAIFYTVKINSAVSAGDAEEARHAAKMAKIWIIAAVIVGIIVDVIAYAFIGVISEMGYYYYY